jgi:anti-sigma factor RsiW
MSDEMDPERFEALIAAYGATPARWPEEERAAAEAFARRDPRAADLLRQADAIDALLFAHRVAEPSRTLRAMVLESAPRRRVIGRRLRLWWSSIAFALVAGAGALAGSAATAALAPAALNLQLYSHDEVLNYDDVPEEAAK